jgi:hypothetical protein
LGKQTQYTCDFCAQPQQPKHLRVFRYRSLVTTSQDELSVTIVTPEAYICQGCAGKTTAEVLGKHLDMIVKAHTEETAP